jgi:hypothetical protein
MIEERKMKIAEIQEKDKKKVEKLRNEISFLETELSRYQQALTLFRAKGLPRVGRWGKPETEGEGEENK